MDINSANYDAIQPRKHEDARFAINIHKSQLITSISSRFERICRFVAVLLSTDAPGAGTSARNSPRRASPCRPSCALTTGGPR